MTYQEPLLRPEVVAEWLAVSPETLKAWRKRGCGPAYIRLSGPRSDVRYSPSAVADYVAAQSIVPN